MTAVSKLLITPRHAVGNHSHHQYTQAEVLPKNTRGIREFLTTKMEVNRSFKNI